MRRLVPLILLCAFVPASCGDEGRAGSGPKVDVGIKPPSPPASWTPAAIESSSAEATYRVRWEPEAGAIPEAEPFAIRIGVRRSDGRPIASDAVFAVDAEMPHHGHGMNLVPAVARLGEDRGETLLLASGLLLHMPGKWVLAVDVGEGGVTERTQWIVDVD